MQTSVKFILIFALLALFFSVGGRAVNLAECPQNEESYSQLSSFDSEQTQAFDDRTEAGLSKLQGLIYFDVEMGLKSVSETNTYTSNYRFRRMFEAFDMLAMMRKFCLLRENLLVLDRSKTFNSDKHLHDVSISSDYYIFALHRILV